MALSIPTNACRRATGNLFPVGSVAFAFAIAAAVPSSTFNWPDVLPEPAGVVLPAPGTATGVR